MKEENIPKQIEIEQPFIIIKNARKISKRRDKARKQSQQYPPSMIKRRKMTLQLSMDSQPIQIISQLKCQSQHNSPYKQCIEQPQSDKQKEEQQHGSIEDQQDKRLNQNIPFPCMQWQLDRQSPFLKSFNEIEQEIGQFKLDD